MTPVVDSSRSIASSDCVHGRVADDQHPEGIVGGRSAQRKRRAADRERYPRSWRRRRASGPPSRHLGDHRRVRARLVSSTRCRPRPRCRPNRSPGRRARSQPGARAAWRWVPHSPPRQEHSPIERAGRPALRLVRRCRSSCRRSWRGRARPSPERSVSTAGAVTVSAASWPSRPRGSPPGDDVDPLDP